MGWHKLHALFDLSSVAAGWPAVHTNLHRWQHKAIFHSRSYTLHYLNISKGQTKGHCNMSPSPENAAADPLENPLSHLTSARMLNIFWPSCVFNSPKRQQIDLKKTNWGSVTESMKCISPREKMSWSKWSRFLNKGFFQWVTRGTSFHCDGIPQHLVSLAYSMQS